MKKKGFTLIELIVVIAIIGVLAAILVPAMLGYVTKSKITTCNTTAKSIYNAFNTALVDMDTSGTGLASSVTSISKTGAAASDTAGSAGYAYKLVSQTYFTDITSPTVDDWTVNITSGACTACGVKQGNYIGCYPNPMTVDAYKSDNAKTVASALTRATSASTNTNG